MALLAPYPYTFAGIGPGPAVSAQGNINAELKGAFVGQFKVQSSLNQGVDWSDATGDFYGTAPIYSAPVRVIVNEPEAGALIRWFCVSYTSGSPVARLSQ